jgi:hypothetical protein
VDGFSSIGGFPNDLQIVMETEEIPQRLPEGGMIVHYQYAAFLELHSLPL